MLRSNQPFPFSTPTRSKFFEIDGVRVGGTYDFQPETGVRFIMDSKRTIPTTLKAILRSHLIAILSRRLPRRSPEKYTISFPIPILGHKELLEIGFLTAAYLLWFRELGYSWALQRHLDPIREQIRNPTRQVLPPKFSAFCEESMVDPPRVGIGKVAGELALVAVIANHAVFLPPADRLNFYETLPDDFQGFCSDIRPLQFCKGHRFDGPMGVMFGTRAVVVPDVIQAGSAQCFLIHLPPGGGAPQILYPLPEDQYEQALKSPHLIRIDLRFPGT
jgi:hypothetical protein